MKKPEAVTVRAREYTFTAELRKALIGGSAAKPAPKGAKATPRKIKVR